MHFNVGWSCAIYKHMKHAKEWGYYFLGRINVYFYAPSNRQNIKTHISK